MGCIAIAQRINWAYFAKCIDFFRCCPHLVYIYNASKSITMLFHTPKLPAEIRIRHLNASMNEQRKKIAQTTASKLELLQLSKQLSKEAKARKKNPQNIYVLDFKGDTAASAVESLREEITLILATAKAGRDRVVVRLESPGGMVHGYGLAAAQLVRLRDAGFNLTICVDKVAASGGYMMACIGSEIVSAPFAILGSIGVVAQVPNFNRLLKEHNVDFELYTAGQYKRTVTMFGENTKEGKAKFEEELQQVHALFKHFVEKYRPQLNVDKVATGEHWLGIDAQELNLVDQLQTSDEYLLSLLPQHDIYVIETRKKPTLGEKLGLQAAQVVDSIVPAVMSKVMESLSKANASLVQLRDPKL
jgi:serine protease SohB